MYNIRKILYMCIYIYIYIYIYTYAHFQRNLFEIIEIVKIGKI